MYDNIGNKIKILAKVTFVLGAIASVIGAICLFFNDAHILLCIITAVACSLFSWISTWLLYGFGEIIDKLCDIEKNTKNNHFQKPEKQIVHKFICEGCGKSISKYPCVICGYNPNDNTQELAQNYDKID